MNWTGTTMSDAVGGTTAIEGGIMRLINNGAICAVKSKEQRRLERFRAAQSRKERNNEKPRMAERAERVRSADRNECDIHIR